MVYTWWIPRQNSGLHFDLPHSRQWARVLIFQIILGAGIRPNFQALTVAFQSAVKSSDVGSATSTFSFVRDLATSIGLVVGESFGAFRRQQNSAYQKRYHWRYLSECLRVFGKDVQRVSANSFDSVHRYMPLQARQPGSEIPGSYIQGYECTQGAHKICDI